MPKPKLDARGIPTPVCPSCGCAWLNVPLQFDPETYEIIAWGLEASCFGCGALVTACTPVDSLSWIGGSREGETE
jgi:hypothetical protein